jgi:hypothetical protein
MTTTGDETENNVLKEVISLESLRADDETTQTRFF